MQTEQKRSEPTLHDVAARANVSFMTVSRALRHPSKVAAPTRERILKAIGELGYVPNVAARNLVSSGSSLVTVVVPNLENLVFAQMIRGISDELRKNSLYLSIGFSGYSLAEEGKLIAAFLAQRPCAMLLHNTVHTRDAVALLKRSGIPVVEMGDLAKKPLDSVVSYSNFEAARASTHHLAARGYKHIAFASVFRKDNIRIEQRLRGYRAALKDLGRPYDERLVFEGALGPLSGGELVDRIIATAPEVDAIFFAGERLAIGAVLECQRRGIKVPARLAIMGFDDYEINTQLSPAITSVAIHRYEIGRAAAKMVIDRVSGTTDGPQSLDLGFSIIQRAST